MGCSVLFVKGIVLFGEGKVELSGYYDVYLNGKVIGILKNLFFFLV